MNKSVMSQACSKTFGNLTATLKVGERWPSRVFHEEWSNFYLFDSDWLFEGLAVEKVSRMLTIEGASCAGLFNLDRDVSEDGSHFVIDKQTTINEYQDRLRGSGPVDGWIYEMTRFGCISDIGFWCIYCERPSELAVVGFKRGVSPEAYQTVLESFHAGRAASVIAGEADYELSSHVISEKWKEEILRNYS